jgi:hypothetical protein
MKLPSALPPHLLLVDRRAFDPLVSLFLGVVLFTGEHSAAFLINLSSSGTVFGR